LFLGAVLLGLAYLRTRSLALPIGIHLGWNWTHGHLLGFGVSGFAQPGWFHPLLQDLPEWVTGGRFGPEASIFAVVADVLLIVLLWKWKGGTAQPDAARLPRDARSKWTASIVRALTRNTPLRKKCDIA